MKLYEKHHGVPQGNKGVRCLKELRSDANGNMLQTKAQKMRGCKIPRVVKIVVDSRLKIKGGR